MVIFWRFIFLIHGICALHAAIDARGMLRAVAPFTVWRWSSELSEASRWVSMVFEIPRRLPDRNGGRPNPELARILPMPTMGEGA